jgi:hypothetical protein
LAAVVTAPAALGLVAAAPAQAGTDLYCQGCNIGAYGGYVNDNNERFLTLSYGHALSPSNGWLCAGDLNSNSYVCNFGETYRSYSGQYAFAAVISHTHGNLNLNAHADF